MPNLKMAALYIGVCVGLFFFLYNLITKKKSPLFNQVAVVILSTTGAVIGFNLLYISLTVEDKFLGQLAEQRLPILLGALAVVWTAVETLLATFNLPSLKEQATKKDDGEAGPTQS